MRYLALFGLSVGLMACTHSPSGTAGSGYLDLDSLLSKEISWLISQDLTLRKEVTLGDSVQVVSLDGDSTVLARELEIFQAINPAQPKYRNAFRVQKEGGEHEYAKVDDSGELQRFGVEYEEDNIARIIGIVREETAIYSAYRDFSIDFDDGRITSFSVEGYQKMILSDTVYFRARTEIVSASSSD